MPARTTAETENRLLATHRAVAPGDRRFFNLALMGSLLLCAHPSSAQARSTGNGEPASLNSKLQAAAAKYEAGQYDEVDALLRELLPASKNFEVHELLGLSYAAQRRSSEAVEQLSLAAGLRPDSVPAHTNLAAALIHAGKPEQAQEECRKALALDPHDYDANRDLAELYLVSNQITQAVPFLEEAQHARPSAYDNSYDLALAYLLTNKLEQSRQQVDSLAQTKDSGELHTLRGRIDEAEGKFVEAANEYGTAAHMDPSEDTLFAWGSELLLHRTYEPAITVFEQGTSRYPNSSRLLIGLGMALYSRGEYEKSIHSLLAAADIDPKDPRCYLFLSKAYLSSPDQAEEVIARFRRYAELEPSNALAQYYYAVSLWKGRRTGDSTVDFRAVENLLQKSISLDGNIADAHLQLGILYNDQHAYDRSLPEYERALELNANLADAHYRLGQYYVHAGDKTKAQQEFDLFKKLQAEHQAQVDKERAEVQQFVISGGADHSAKP